MPAATVPLHTWLRASLCGYDAVVAGTGVYGAQKREDYLSDDVEQYFNYMGMLAEQVPPLPRSAFTHDPANRQCRLCPAGLSS